ncbi:hypothetical protein [Novosphingobium sp. EMRT-2]|uniref:hypothetical protein n=1 Tax=Novosphingobium sp. EMRT-2 TaxID=2571749 RepID=UPI0010BDD748|nr:hypothetical protein [Novosphingobium sp. EMRT-2]QCI92134.1 hypothetical protein FA702_00145 [Novosphingobium sp. EMRT-2]
MGLVHDIAARAAYATVALGTLGTCPIWDAAVSAYLCRLTLQNADAEFGSLAKSIDETTRLSMSMKQRHGERWCENPALADTRSRIAREDLAANDQWTDDFCRPLWRAANELAATPAPTLAAATFKALMIEYEEVWNDTNFSADCMDILQADFSRLAGDA